MKAEQYIAKFNELRNELIKEETFTKQDLLDSLDLYGISIKIWNELRNNQVIEYVSGGRNAGPELFRFTKPEQPVHVALLQKVFDDKSKRQNEHNRKYRQNKQANNYSEEEAINLLKSLGYKIYKPTTTYEEI